ncbi:hypothetical protein [Microbacterium sp. UCD-TDU]|uniref:hypothetical protein n=1 Tax=Microbacterium sp. UCD-TDU TaxID=1247714 RepID=UPI00034DB282|nr:hypothetical protein [Microbacterium sp. UCD-TDU]EYT59719.1 hypothetical protein D514_0108140 [Microbacterium sp. UCD-TDU]
MSTRFSAADMARAHLSQAELDEYDAYIAEHDDPLKPAPTTPQEETIMAEPRYAIDQNYKQFDENGLPAYPKSTAATEAKLRNVQKQLKTAQSRVEAALDRALDQFEVSLEAEDRKRSTQERLADMTRRNRRI